MSPHSNYSTWHGSELVAEVKVLQILLHKDDNKNVALFYALYALLNMHLYTVVMQGKFICIANQAQGVQSALHGT